MDDILLEPVKAFADHYENRFADNAKTRLDELIDNSHVNAEENRATVKQLREEERLRDEAHGRASMQKGLRVFLIVLIVAAFIVAIIGIFSVMNSVMPGAVMIPVGIAAGVGFILLIVLVINPKIKNNMAAHDKHDKKARELTDKAWTQMQPLNALFESNETKNLIEKTVPLLKIDDNFDMRRYDYLSGKYGFTGNQDMQSSTIAILSGEILGNPFVVDREMYQYMGMHTYRGTLVISWTTTYRDSEGHVHTQHHTQTLVATVEKPKPEYSERTRLIYGNEAAPDLVFTHSPTHAERMSDREYESAIKSGMKKIQKQQQKALKKGESTFTEMGNAEFDVMFNALDRNNEVQFRLLFTPLAQKNMTTLMRSPVGYGDDFNFYKRKCLNFVSSEHSAAWDLDTSYKRYASYDIDTIIDNFMSFNTTYFKNMYFEFAPLLSIPLYQQHKPHEYIYSHIYERNYTDYEAECAVNRMGRNVFCHSDSATDSILKTDMLRKDGKSDELNVTAYSFRTEERVDFVQKLGGDGHIHSVPVPWTEYIPVERTSTVKLKQLDMTDKEFERRSNSGNMFSGLDMFGGRAAFTHGLLCCLMTAQGDTMFDKHLEGVLK